MGSGIQASQRSSAAFSIRSQRASRAGLARIHTPTAASRQRAATPTGFCAHSRVARRIVRRRTRMYRGQSGHWSWLLHRITGLGVLLFLLVHIVDITLIGFGPKVYNDAVAIFSYGPIRFVSLALIASVLFHGLNGIRIILIDFWASRYKYQRQM